MGRIVLLLLFPIFLFASHVELFKWNNGESFLTFLERKKLPLSLFYNLDNDDKKLTEDIPYTANCQMLVSSKHTMDQILIPVNDELQLHIYLTPKKRYAMDVIPIISETYKEILYTEISTVPYDAILKASGSAKLASKFVKIFKGRVDFKKNVKPGDPIVIVYEQKYRLSKPFSMPEVAGAMVEIGGVKYALYKHNDGHFYDAKGAQIEKLLFKIPIKNPRITSNFSKSRYHPILHRYRAHLGVDFGARPGTPILATGDGRVCFEGSYNGYGKTIKIRHSNGLVSLYAHQKSFCSGIHNGSSVKQGEVIGYVGSSGLSSGPHLHFGMYDGSTAINPLGVMKKTTEGFSGKEQKVFAAIRSKLDSVFNEKLRTKPKKVPFVDFQNIYYVDKDTFRVKAF
ncbi:MAG: peptidoglycan DD-metalloendopeptidase family protein [Sulfuricurvum sp.]|uniref:peptidoglycan DD-metalloendopeptidase family protein n=1 Tax=Sulfuricurvum sp. TaxID=2025608 RepID=UPI00260CB9B2|nr:peptidoglycan DD-metalloendopeptidase family protein [Sulfuricurvum sp.]MDD2828581.1 peptidoglycan DD-metalloendopeptidase family protein [Sulfuricurvum sp.]MDD4948258.1 peptidoglycan DD-metalloendopeptidase family protein [Sulfuricurvum sp.]